MSTSFLRKSIYEIIVALVTLSSFPLIVAIVAPLASFARILSFIVREIRLNHQRKNADAHNRHRLHLDSTNNKINQHEINNNESSTNLNEKTLHKIAEKVQQAATTTAASSTANESSKGGIFSTLLNSSNNNHDEISQASATRPNEHDCVVVVNAASSLEGEGLVRYYAARGTTVVACDRNSSLLSEIFRNEDSNLVRPCALYGPETVNRVRDVVASLCGSNNSNSISNNVAMSTKRNLTLFAIIFVEPSGEIVVRRTLEREFLINASSSSSSASISKNNLNVKNNKNNAEVMTVKLCEYLTRTSGGEIPQIAESSKKIKKHSSENDDSDHDHNSGKNKNHQQQHHRRTSSLDATAAEALLQSDQFRNSSRTSSSKKSIPLHHSKTFSEAASKTLSDQAMESFVFIPVKTQTALLRELIPIALKNNNNNTSTSSADNINHTGIKNNASLTPSLQPRVCIMTRPDEGEELSTALCLLQYSTTLMTSSSSSLPSSTSNNLFLSATPNPDLQSIQTIAGISKMRRLLMESLVDVCHSLRRESDEAFQELSRRVGENDTLRKSDKKNFLRCCHIELFSTAAQRSSQQLWKQSLADFVLMLKIAHKMNGRTYIVQKRKWSVPRLPFSFFCDDQKSGDDADQENRNNNSESPNNNNRGSSLFNDRNSLQKSSPQDISTCSFQISFLGETINGPKPKTSKYFCPQLGILEDKSKNDLFRRRLIAQTSDEDGVEETAGFQDAESSIGSSIKFVPLSFWTRVLSWSFREERILDVMVAGFHSSPRLENLVKKIFGYVCS